MDSDESKPQPDELKSMPWWWAHVRFNGLNADGMVTQEWRGNYKADENLEQVHFDRPIEAGRLWEVNDTVLGRPLPLYRSPFYRGGLEIRRPLLAHTSIRLGMDPGDAIRSIREITHVDHRASLYLFQDIPLDAFTGLYDEGGHVRLQVSRGTRFYLAHLGKGPHEPDEAGAIGFRQRFDQLSEENRLVLLRHIGLPRPDMFLALHPPARFYVRKAADSDDWFWLYVAQAPDGNGSISPGRTAAPPTLSPQNLPSVAITQGVAQHPDDAAEELIRQIKLAHEDNVHLVYPTGVLACTELRSGASHLWGGFSYKHPWSPAASASMEPSSLSPYAEPLVKMISGVRNRCHMRVIPAPSETLDWKWVGEHEGELQREPSTNSCFYLPAEAPKVDYDYQGKTQRPCALKRDGFKPVVIDKVQTGTPENPLYTTFVVLNAEPTHYFKPEFRMGGYIELALFYRTMEGEEVRVHPGNTEWHVLAGTGFVNYAGFFEPGRLTDPFSVVLAIEKDDRRWYWAVIIVPLALQGMHQFLTMINKTV